jgi:hypothetical protein
MLKHFKGLTYPNKFAVTIGIFLISFICFYNFLCFIPYDIYAVSPLFLWTPNFFLDHITPSFEFNNYISLFFIQFFYSRLTAAIVFALLITILFLTYRLLLYNLSKSELIINISSLSIALALLIIPRKNIAIDTISLIIILWCILLINKIANIKKMYLVVIVLGFILWWTIQPLFLFYMAFLPVTLFNANKSLSYKILIINLLLFFILYGLRYFFKAFTPEDARWLFIKGYVSPNYSLLFLLLISTPLVITCLTKAKYLLIYSTLVLAILLLNSINYIRNNSFRNTEAIIKYKFCSSEWVPLLKFASMYPELSQTSALCVNFALYKDNHITDRAFLFNQHYATDGLIPIYELNNTKSSTSLNFFYNRNAILLSEVYYNLGLYSIVQRIATDFLAHFENQPQALLILTKNHLAHGENEAAAKYATILNQNPLYKKKVENIMHHTEKRLICNDSILTPIFSYPLMNLESLLKSPVKNQMALEYYITYALMEKNFTVIPFIVEKLTEYGYTELPADFEYFVYLDHSLNKEPCDITKFRNNQNRYKFYTDFYQRMLNVTNDKEARLALEKFKNSYLYFYVLNN